jgi:iron complex transport system substrate-binding protein
VLVQWWPKPVIAPGARSWVTDLLSAVGGRNILENDNCKSRPLTDDEVRKLAAGLSNPATHRPGSKWC